MPESFCKMTPQLIRQPLEYQAESLKKKSHHIGRKQATWTVFEEKNICSSLKHMAMLIQ